MIGNFFSKLNKKFGSENIEIIIFIRNIFKFVESVFAQHMKGGIYGIGFEFLKTAQDNYNKTVLSKYVDFWTYASTWSNIRVDFFSYFLTLEPKYKKKLIDALYKNIAEAKFMGSYLYPSRDDSEKLLVLLEPLKNK